MEFLAKCLGPEGGARMAHRRTRFKPLRAIMTKR
jgi:hypothetical protein